tara:strand:+ start:2443 stop:4728 length:2286 start_codon:yes stop_codon:yes gene_type:complete
MLTLCVVGDPPPEKVESVSILGLDSLGGTQEGPVVTIANSEFDVSKSSDIDVQEGKDGHDASINNNQVTGFDGTVEGGDLKGNFESAETAPTSTGTITTLNNAEGTLGADGTVRIDGSGTTSRLDIVGRSISPTTPITQTTFQDARDLVIHPDGNWEAAFMKEVEITRPRFQAFLDDNQNVRRSVLPVKAATLSSAENVRFENGTLVADKADRVVVDGAESSGVFDLSLGASELDVEIPQEYVALPALSFASAAQITVADYQYNKIQDGKLVILDNTILFAELTSGDFGNAMQFPNPIPGSTDEISTTLDKNKQLLYLIKTVNVKERKLLKELVLEQLTNTEITALVKDYERKVGPRTLPPTDTVFRYLQDGYKRFTINLLPLPTAKIQSVKNAFDEFYNNQDLQDELYSLLQPEEQEVLATKYLELKNYDLNLGSYSLTERKAFVYLVSQQGVIDDFLFGIDGVRRDVLREIGGKLKEKVVERPAKQMNIVVDEGTVVEFSKDDDVKITGTATGEGKIFVTEANPVQYIITNEILEYDGGDYTDEIKSERGASTTEIDLRLGMECMVLSPESAFTFTDDDESYQVQSPHFYSLCQKRDESQVINEDLLCSNCGFVNYINKSKVLNGFVSYRRLLDGDFSDVYVSLAEENNGIFVMDDSMGDIMFLILKSTSDEDILAETYFGNYIIRETSKGTVVEAGGRSGLDVKGYVSSDEIITLSDDGGALLQSKKIGLGNGQGFFTKLLQLINGYYMNGDTFENLI